MILLGDALERLKELEADSVDAVCTDPPYGWRFMGKAWDGADIEKMANEATGKDPRVCADGIVRKPRQNNLAIAAGKYDQSLKGNEAFSAWTELYAKEILRVLKPGGHALIFCGPRTYHAMAFGVERAGFEIRDMLSWIFGSGFPKSHNLKGDWQGWGTALKPSLEPIVLARKPLSEKTVAKNVLRWGVGGLNIDASRIAGVKASGSQADFRAMRKDTTGFGYHGDSVKTDKWKDTTQGRWPANLIFSHHDECKQEGYSKIKSGKAGNNSRPFGDGNILGTAKEFKPNNSETYGDENGLETVEKWTCHPDCPIHLLDEQTKDQRASKPRGGQTVNRTFKDCMFNPGKDNVVDGSQFNDSGGASRFFYCAKASKRERNLGLEGETKEKQGARPNSADSTGKFPDHDHRPSGGNNHPTVKPLKLMEYLIKLICPSGGTVLDPFAGSGSTGVAAFRLGFKFIGIEMSEEYAEIARKRLEHALKESAS